jgi:hypothetical protein
VPEQVMSVTEADKKRGLNDMEKMEAKYNQKKQQKNARASPTDTLPNDRKAGTNVK